MSSSHTGACYISQRASYFTRKLAKSRLGGGVYALSELVAHMSLWRGSYAPIEGRGPGEVGLGVCESSFTHLNKREDDR